MAEIPKIGERRNTALDELSEIQQRRVEVYKASPRKEEDWAQAVGLKEAEPTPSVSQKPPAVGGYMAESIKAAGGMHDLRQIAGSVRDPSLLPSIGDGQPKELTLNQDEAMSHARKFWEQDPASITGRDQERRSDIIRNVKININSDSYDNGLHTNTGEKADRGRRK